MIRAEVAASVRWVRPAAILAALLAVGLAPVRPAAGSGSFATAMPVPAARALPEAAIGTGVVAALPVSQIRRLQAFGRRMPSLGDLAHRPAALHRPAARVQRWMRAPSARPASASEASSCAPFRRVPSPNPPSRNGTLDAVTALSPSDAWAVGQYESRDGYSKSLIEHWNGSRWSVVPSPNPTAEEMNGVVLNAVSASAPGDVWAAGWYSAAGISSLTLLEHWNGSRWSIVPGGSDDAAMLFGVVALSERDAWAVGADYASNPAVLVEHWNGKTWSRSRAPTPSLGDGDSAALTGLAFTSPSDVWAAGFAGSNTLTERWNGSKWRIVPSPTPKGGGELEAVASLKPNDAWAVGSQSIPHSSRHSTLIEHWNGRAWSLVASPNTAKADTELTSITAGPHGGLIAAGLQGDMQGRSQPLVESMSGGRWSLAPAPAISSDAAAFLGSAGAGSSFFAVGPNLTAQGPRTLAARLAGGTWKVLPSQDLPIGVSTLAAVTAPDPNDAWAVGSYLAPVSFTFFGFYLPFNRPLIEHWNGVRWSIVPGSPQPAGDLYSVSADSPSDVWAVGDHLTGEGYVPLAEHWNGKQWKTAADNAPYDDSPAGLDAVATVSPGNAWAGGYYDTSGYGDDVTMVQRWTGSTWKNVSDASQGTLIEGMDRRGPNDIWAAGYDVEHWDGGKWKVLLKGRNNISYSAVARPSAHEAWAVGVDNTSGLVEHWNGKAWTQVPAAGNASRLPMDVAGSAASDVWAVGVSKDGPLAEHWNGSTWSAVLASGAESVLEGVALVGAHQIWAAGSSTPSIQGQTN